MAKKNSYWQQRIQEQQDKSYKRLNEETERELAAVYHEQATALRDRILEVFAKIEAQKAAGEPIQANDLYRNRRYWQLLEEINRRLKILGREQIRITQPAIIQAYQETLDIVDSNIESSTPLGAATVNKALMNAHAIDANQVINQVWCLDGKNFSDRVWTDKQKLIPQIKKALSDALVQGKSPWEIAKAMSDRLEVSRENAYRLVRTETAHAQVYAQTQRYKEYGFTKGRFLASPDCCHECQEHDGEVYTLEELEKMLPVHPRCRCSYTLVGD